MSSALDQDLAATLTPEELEAINGTDVPPEDVDALKALAEGADDGDDTDDDDNDDDNDDAGNPNAAPVEGQGAAPAPAQDANAASDAQGNEGDDTQPAIKAEASFVPKYEAKLPAEFDQMVARLDEHEKDLKAKFKEGEIEFDQYEEAREKIIQIRSKLEAQRIKAEISQEMTQQTAAQQWTATVNGYLDAVAKEVNYRDSPELAGDLDLFVKQLASRQENADKPMTWFLAEADKRVRALHNLQTTRAAQAPAPTQAQIRPNRKPPLDAAPRNLAQVPGGDGPGDVGGEFAHLDSLEGDDLEAAIAKMTPAQREKFARS